MSKVSFKVQRELCGECSLALRRFVGGMAGVTGVNVESGAVAVEFDDAKIPEQDIRKMTRDSIERLGYRIEQD